MKKIKIGKPNIKTILNAIYTLFLIALFSLAILFILSRFKTPLNLMAFNVMSGSMEPDIKIGSIVFVRPADEYKTQDVITFRSRETVKTTFTHRITRIEKDPDINKLLYYTKGDANPQEDIAPVDAGLVLGKVFLVLPLLGYPLAFAQTQLGFILLIVIPSTLIIYSELQNIKEELVKSISEKRDSKKKTSPMPIPEVKSVTSIADKPKRKLNVKK